jgi:PEP-CTERM motif
MRLVHTASAAALAAGLLLATPVAATVFVFDITGSFTSNFRIDTSRGPDRTNNQLGGLLTQINYENRPVLFNGIERNATIIFGSGLAASFQLLGPGIPFTQLSGATLFSGPLATPTFTPGRFELRNPFFRQAITIDVSQAAGAVPEPASWAMLIAGFGLIGAAARRQRLRIAA